MCSSSPPYPSLHLARFYDGCLRIKSWRSNHHQILFATDGDRIQILPNPTVTPKTGRSLTIKLPSQELPSQPFPDFTDYVWSLLFNNTLKTETWDWCLFFQLINFNILLPGYAHYLVLHIQRRTLAKDTNCQHKLLEGRLLNEEDMNFVRRSWYPVIPGLGNIHKYIVLGYIGVNIGSKGHDTGFKYCLPRHIHIHIWNHTLEWYTSHGPRICFWTERYLQTPLLW